MEAQVSCSLSRCDFHCVPQPVGEQGNLRGHTLKCHSSNRYAVLPGELAEQVDFSCGDALNPPGTVGTQQSPPHHSLSHQDVHGVKKKGRVTQSACFV